MKNWTFGKYIERILAEKEWSLSKLAKKMGMSHSYVSAIINGGSSRDKNPPKISVDTLIQLAKALQVSDIDLLMAYKGVDVSATKEGTGENVDFIREVMLAMVRHGQEFQNLPEKDRKSVLTSVAGMTQKFIDIAVENELKRPSGK